MPARGSIGFISQSGAFCATSIDWARGEGFGFSQVVSLGNQADVSEVDALTALAADEHTRAIVIYMESVSDGHRFVEVASEVTRLKPVVALKVGGSEAGRRAALSHTGALAGAEAAFSAAFEKAGVARAATSEQLFDWARALADCPLPHGRRLAILTDAGGPGVIAADAAEKEGLLLADLAEATINALAAELPAAASLRNPVDMLASASPETYAACLETLLDDPKVDAALVILPPPPMFSAESIAQSLIPVIQSAEKPVLLALMGSTLTAKALEVFSQARIPAYPFPERAASALAALAQRAGYLEATVIRSGDASHRTAFTRPPGAASAEELCAAYGIQTAPVSLASSAQDAAAIGEALGFPVVMKIASADIPHKSDVDGVILEIKTPEACSQTYTQLMGRVASRLPGARIDGVWLQRQVLPGQDVIAGITRDPQFGPLVMFGSGGIEVEGLGDVSFGLAPLSVEEASELISRTWAGRKLNGYRSIPPADVEAVRNVLVNLSRLAVEQTDIEEIEINPLRVLARGAIALDIRMRRGSGPARSRA